MQTRPKIKPGITGLDKTIEFIALFFLVFMWLLTIYVFYRLPAVIPTHFDALGRVNDYGNKTMLLVLPILGTIVYFGLTQLNKHPHTFNYIKKITNENAMQQYKIATRMLRFLKLAVLVIFTLITLFTYSTTTGVTNGLGTWFLPLALCFIFIPLMVSLVQSLKTKVPAG
jgi:uncharacterized membrane protein